MHVRVHVRVCVCVCVHVRVCVCVCVCMCVCVGGDRLHARQIFPWHPSRGKHGTDYMQDETSLPLAPFSGEPGDRIHAGRDKPSPGTPLRETRRQTTWRTKKPSPGTPLEVNRGQTTCRTGQASILHMASMRSFLSYFKAWQCSKKCSSFSISAVVQHTRSGLFLFPTAGIPFSVLPLLFSSLLGQQWGGV